MKKFYFILIAFLFIYSFSYGELNLQKITPQEFNFKSSDKTGNVTKSEEKDFGTELPYKSHFQFGGSGTDYIKDIVTDVSGNCYVTGHFSGEMSYSGSTYNAVGEYDAFVAKFDDTGSLLWLNQIMTTANESVNSLGIYLDDSDNIFITGSYTGVTTFGSIDLPDNATKNLFVAKLNSSGLILGAQNYGNTGETVIGIDIELDSSGNIFVISSTDIREEWLHQTIMLKYNPDFTIMWEKNYDESFQRIKVIGTSIYIGGTFVPGSMDGFLSLDVTLSMPVPSNNQMFICKADLSLNFIWATLAGNETLTPGDSFLELIDVDDNENIYVSGQFRYDISFNEDTLQTNYINTGFLAKCNTTGSFLWGKKLDNKIIDFDIDNTGNIISADEVYISTYDTDGVFLSNQSTNITPSSLKISSSDKLFLGGNFEAQLYINQSSLSLVQDWEAQFTGNTASGSIINMTHDTYGNIYTLGQVTGIIEFMEETINQGIFILKQDFNGNKVWLKQMEYAVDMSTYYFCENLQIDTINDYLYFSDFLDADLIVDEETTLSSNSNAQIFILKFDFDGNCIWSKVEDLGVDKYSDDIDIETDKLGNIILSTLFEGTINIGATQLTSDGYRDGLLVKYNSAGDLQWAIKAGGESEEYVSIITLDNNNNIILTGEFQSENIIVNQTSISLLEGDGNTILAKLNPDGTVQWLKSTASSSEIGGDNYSWPTGIIFASDESFYLKGWHGSSQTFGSITLTNEDYSYSYYIAKFDANGDAVWAKSIKEKYFGFDYNNFDVDNESNVYFGAQAKNTLEFGTDYIFNTTSNSDLFVAKYNNLGDLEWVKTYLGVDRGKNNIKSVIEHNGEIYVGLNYFDYIAFADQEITTTNQHGLIIKYSDKSIASIENNIKDNNICVYPNPSVGKFTIKVDDIREIRIYDLTGKSVWQSKHNTNEVHIDLSEYGSGIYFMDIHDGKENYKAKVIIK